MTRLKLSTSSCALCRGRRVSESKVPSRAAVPTPRRPNTTRAPRPAQAAANPKPSFVNSIRLCGIVMTTNVAVR